MKYNYFEETGQFVRADNRGHRYNLEWVDAVEVATLTVKGYSVEYIHQKLGLDSSKISVVNLASFVRNFLDGDIVNMDPRDYENVMWYDRIRDKFNRWLNG